MPCPWCDGPAVVDTGHGCSGFVLRGARWGGLAEQEVDLCMYAGGKRDGFSDVMMSQM